MVVGNGLPVTGSGIVFGASTSLPFTLTLILSIGGVAGFGTSVAAPRHRLRRFDFLAVHPHLDLIDRRGRGLRYLCSCDGHLRIPGQNLSFKSSLDRGP